MKREINRQQSAVVDLTGEFSTSFIDMRRNSLYGLGLVSFTVLEFKSRINSASRNKSSALAIARP